MDPQLASEIKEIGNKFKSFIKSLDDKTLRDVLQYAAQPLIESASRSAPRSTRTHYRYSTPKLARSLRAPNGKGVRIATYGPGNLSRSIRALSFRRMKRSILVGPKLAKGSKKGKFTGNGRVDGFYAHFVEFGTKKQRANPFMKSAAAQSRSAVVRRLQTSLDRLMQRKIRLLNLN